MENHNKPDVGTISASELYTRDSIIRRLGIGNATFRNLRDAGLPIIRFGSRVYLSGRQVIQFLERFAGSSSNTGESS